MSSIRRPPHLIIVGHSRKWSTSISAEYREQVRNMLAEAESILQQHLPGLAIRPVFFPQEKTSSERNQDEILKMVLESSYAILDVTDFDEELAYIAGTLAAASIPGLMLVSDSGSVHAKSRWPFDTKLVRYQTVEDLKMHVETICAELAQVLENIPVPARFIYTVWFPRDVSSIWVVCPQIEEPGEFAQPSSPDYTYLDNLGDTDSLLEVMVFLSRYYPSASIEKFSSKDLPIGLTKGNLVVIGGPGDPDTISNHLTRSMMEAAHSRIAYSEDCESMIIRREENENIELQATLATKPHSEDRNDRFNLVMDYAYFARFRNPANESNQVVCINGIHTLGVLGAARAFGDSREALRNYQTILTDSTEAPQFESYFEVNVLNGNVRVPEVTRDKTFRLNTVADEKRAERVQDRRHNEAKTHQNIALDPSNALKESKRVFQQKTSRLRLVRVLARQIAKSNGKIFENMTGIFVLHALQDLVPFLEVFESLGLQPSQCLFYYKRYPYYKKEETLAWLRERGYQLEALENRTKTLPQFLEATNPSSRIFILEDGGYVGPLLHQLDCTPWNQIVGAVEQTERGVRMYEQLKNLLIPVAPVARSHMKNRQEPPHVGRSIVANIQQLLEGRNLAGMRCLIIGYGRIGETVCKAARDTGMNVSVFDSDHGALAKAAQASFNTGDVLRTLLSNAQIVIGTTGNESLGREHILSLQHNTVLVSGSSGQYEIGIDALDVLSRQQRSVDVGTQYTLEKEDRIVLLLGDGYPINFVGGDSVPDEAIDPVLAALFILTAEMVMKPPNVRGIQLDWTNQVISHYELEKLFFELYISR